MFVSYYFQKKEKEEILGAGVTLLVQWIEWAR
jgi:hypothetical protein